MPSGSDPTRLEGMDAPNALLTTSQAAARLGVTPGWIRRLTLRGELPAQKRGRDLFIRASDLDALERRSVGRPRKGEERHQLASS